MSLLTHLAFILVTDDRTDEEDVYEGERNPRVTKGNYPVAVNTPHQHILKIMPDIARAVQAQVRLVEGYDFQTLRSADVAGFWLPAQQRRMRTAIAFLEPAKSIARLIFRDKPSTVPLIPLIFGNQPDILVHHQLNLLPYNSIPILMTLRTIHVEDGRS